MFAELDIEQALHDSFAEIRAEPTLLDSLTEGLPPDRAAECAGFLTTAHVSIRHAFPVKNAETPCISILIDPEEETGQYVGMSEDDYIDEDDGLAKQRYLAGFSTQYVCMVASVNASAVVYLSNFVKWALLRKRFWLQGQGLLEQRVGQKSFQPLSLDQPDFVYARAVNLACMHLDDFVLGGEVPLAVDSAGDPIDVRVTIEDTKLGYRIIP